MPKQNKAKPFGTFLPQIANGTPRSAFRHVVLDRLNEDTLADYTTNPEAVSVPVLIQAPRHIIEVVNGRVRTRKARGDAVLRAFSLI
jgi:hypothetical protein